MFDVRDRDFLAKLNSATKYPETPTYHFMDKKSGLLQEDQCVDFFGQKVQVTEKIDGTNGRIIILPSQSKQVWVIGSREDLLSCSEDHMINPNLGIVDTLRGLANEIYDAQMDGGIDRSIARVYFFEVYGGTVGSRSKEYTTDRSLFGARLFDVIEYSADVFADTMSFSRELIAGWRDRGNQPFLGHDDFTRVAQETNIHRVPVLDANFDGALLPSMFSGAQLHLDHWLPNGSEAMLDMKAPGGPEGVVLKSHDRKVTAKMRFADYESTIRRNNDAARKAAKTREKETIVE